MVKLKFVGSPPGLQFADAVMAGKFIDLEVICENSQTPVFLHKIVASVSCGYIEEKIEAAEKSSDAKLLKSKALHFIFILVVVQSFFFFVVNVDCSYDVFVKFVSIIYLGI